MKWSETNGETISLRGFLCWTPPSSCPGVDGGSCKHHGLRNNGKSDMLPSVCKAHAFYKTPSAGDGCFSSPVASAQSRLTAGRWSRGSHCSYRYSPQCVQRGKGASSGQMMLPCLEVTFVHLYPNTVSPLLKLLHLFFATPVPFVSCCPDAPQAAKAERTA